MGCQYRRPQKLDTVELFLLWLVGCGTLVIFVQTDKSAGNRDLANSSLRVPLHCCVKTTNFKMEMLGSSGNSLLVASPSAKKKELLYRAGLK